MRKLTKAISAVCVMLSVGSAFAADNPATQPAQAPTPAPAVQPAPAVDAKVLILPFAPTQPSDLAWIGKAIQQSLAADLSRSNNGTAVQPITDNTIANTTADALAAGKKANAKYVVFGSYQEVDPNLRITGQVLETDTGRVVAGLKSTGANRDLFEMQDTLAFQTRWGLGMDQLAGKKTAQTPPPTIDTQGPVQVSDDSGRYPGSSLYDAVNNDQSLIDQNNAAGQAYRESYYDNPLYDYPYGYGYGYYPMGYYGFGGNTLFINSGCWFPFCHFRFIDHRHRAVPFDHGHDGRHDGHNIDGNHSVWHPMNGFANVNGFTPMTNGFTPMTMQRAVPMTLQSPVRMTQQGGAIGGRGGSVAVPMGGMQPRSLGGGGGHR